MLLLRIVEHSTSLNPLTGDTELHTLLEQGIMKNHVLAMT